MPSNVAVVILSKTGDPDDRFRQSLREKHHYMLTWTFSKPDQVERFAQWWGLEEVDLIVAERSELSFWKKRFPEARLLTDLS